MEELDRPTQWANGEHTSTDGSIKKLSEMGVRQLDNTINKYKKLGYDVSSLEAELAKRPLPTQN